MTHFTSSPSTWLPAFSPSASKISQCALRLEVGAGAAQSEGPALLHAQPQLPRSLDRGARHGAWAQVAGGFGGELLILVVAKLGSGSKCLGKILFLISFPLFWLV